MNRRDQIAMTAEEQSAYLASAKTLILTSIDREGYPHSVAMWFALIDGLVHMTTFRKSQKAVNLRRNPKVGLLAESGATYSELRGLMVRGRAEIDDIDVCLHHARVQPRYFGPADPSVQRSCASRRRNASSSASIPNVASCGPF